jgi:hypothetical protein
MPSTAGEKPDNKIFNGALLGLLGIVILIIVALGAAGYYVGGTFGVVTFVVIAGIIGGGINAMITDNGFLLPDMAASGDTTIIRPGFVGNILAGIVAAVVSWGLYGSFASTCVIGCAGTQAGVSLTFTAFVGAILVGMGGARWLSNEADKKMLAKAAALSLGSDKNVAAASEMVFATPARALRIAESNSPHEG